MPGEEFYLIQFDELGTERQIGMSIGPIPVSRIEERGERLGLYWDTMGIFKRLIRDLDRAYLKWQADEAERKRNK